MSTKFQQLLDYIVNEEMDKANELFHEIVVEKSRSIYENLIAEEDDEVEESMKDDEMDESMNDEMDEGTEELEDSFSMEADEEDGFDDEDDDATGMLGQEIGADDDMDDMDGAEGDEEQAMFDIKNAIEELEAAFAELEAAQGGEMGDDEFGDEEGDEFGDEEMGDEDEELEMGMFEGRRLREYREKVSDGHGAEKKGAAEGGIAGANTGEKMPSGTNTKSAINANADRTKPTSGANAGNILRKSATADEDGTTPRGKVGGLVKSGGQFTKGVEKNIASSANAGMKSGSATSKQGAGYPGNNKTPGPVGSGSGDKAGQTNIDPATKRQFLPQNTR
jgi:hypothetical protein